MSFDALVASMQARADERNQTQVAWLVGDTSVWRIADACDLDAPMCPQLIICPGNRRAA